jgi:plastocyanin
VRSSWAILLAALVVTATGCGGDSDGGSAPTPTPTQAAKRPPAVVQVDMKDIKFKPRRIVVRLGQTVRWTNLDNVPHTVASASLRLSSPAIQRDQTFTYRPKRRGSFRYFCTIHANQNGRLIVR